MSLADLRKEYTRAGLTEDDVSLDPFIQFGKWFGEAGAAGLPEPNAMTVATATLDGRPSARVVLLKEFDQQGFVFYTNYTGRKGIELTANPWAALLFYWPELERQVRIEGHAAQIPSEESDAYFQSRPRASRLGAWASPQSQVISDRDVLNQHMQSLGALYLGDAIPRPAHWGGYRVAPQQIEFWQGRPSRLHDRLRYYLDADGTWKIERLAP